MMAELGLDFEGHGKKARIEIIPLIDVIFFLLATFVLFTLSLNKIKSVPVNLPFAGVDGGITDEDLVTLQVSDANAVYWNKDLISLNEIPARLAHYKLEVVSPRIFIAGDDRAKFGETLRVLDLVRKAGIQTVSVETRTTRTGK
jgi:biopolymer transport protein ExbD